MIETFPEGVITAVVTPITEDYHLDHDLLYDHCTDILAKGGAGIVLMGTTGEANSFSCDEREEALVALVKRGFPAHKIMVSTGTCALTDTVRLSKHACSMGVGGVLVMPPFFYHPVTDSGLYEYFSEVVRRVEDEDLRIYLYHFPKMSGVQLSVELISRLRQAFPGVFCGMKDSSGDINHMKEILSKIKDFALYSGTERYMIDVLEGGGKGCISATTNFTLPFVMEAYRCFSEGKPSQSAIKRMLEGRGAFEGYVFAAAIKGIMARSSKNPNWNRLRPPLISLSNDSLDKIENDLPTTGSSN